MDALSIPAMVIALVAMGIASYGSWAHTTRKSRLLNAYYQYQRYLKADLDPCIIIGLFVIRAVKFCPKRMEVYLDIIQDEFGEWHEYRWTTPQAYNKAIKGIH
jgi:hypothetical protein